MKQYSFPEIPTLLNGTVVQKVAVFAVLKLNLLSS